MKKMIFPVITDFDMKLSCYIVSVECSYEQEHISRTNGSRQFDLVSLYIQKTRKHLSLRASHSSPSWA